MSSLGSPGALDGLLVADFSRVLAGPYATMLLADLGAEVVKVERPGSGDDTRQWGPPFDAAGRSTYFQSVNRNKRSVALDLRDETDAGVARDLALRADVLVENFAPGTMDRFGLGYDDLARENVGLVYASITGFGAAAALPGYDLLVQAVGGLMSVTGPDAASPTKVGVALVDVIAGLHCAVGVLAALRHRSHSGRGQRVEVSLLSSLLSALVNQASGFLGAGVVPRALGNAHPSIAPYETFQAADRQIAVAVGNDTQFAALCRVVGHPEWSSDARFVTNPLRVQHREALRAMLEAVLGERAAADWCETLTTAGVPAGPVNGVDEAFALAEVLGLEPVVRVPDTPGPARQVAHPVRFSLTPPSYRSAPPALGSSRWLPPSQPSQGG